MVKSSVTLSNTSRIMSIVKAVVLFAAYLAAVDGAAVVKRQAWAPYPMPLFNQHPLGNRFAPQMHHMPDMR